MSLINSFPHSGEILHYYIKIKEGRGGGGGEKNLRWVCAAGLSETPA